MPPTPVAMPGFQQPMQPGHYMAPMGNQAWYLFETIRTNKAELKVSDAQWKTIQDARDADQKTRMDRSMQTMNTRRDLQTLADTDTPDIAKIEARVRDLKKAEGDDMMADFRLTALYRTTLTAAQREQLKTLAPKFEPMMPGGPGMMPGRPGIMPGGPGMMPGGPAMMPGGTPPAAPGSPGGQPMTPPNPKRP
jgi:Spy/CpxP family protein refolding chaperone